MKMSLVGFEHVFADSANVWIAPELTVKIASLPVVTLLKIAAYLDNPYDREKDVEDLAAILARHEPEQARRFSDEIVMRHLNYEAVGAYWIGKDLRALCSMEEKTLVDHFISQLSEEHSRTYQLFVRQMASSLDDDGASKAEILTEALRAGFGAAQ